MSLQNLPQCIRIKCFTKRQNDILTAMIKSELNEIKVEKNKN